MELVVADVVRVCKIFCRRVKLVSEREDPVRTFERGVTRTTLLICLTHSLFAIYVSERGREKLHMHTVPRLPLDQSQRLTSPATIHSNNIDHTPAASVRHYALGSRSSHIDSSLYTGNRAVARQSIQGLPTTEFTSTCQ